MLPPDQRPKVTLEDLLQLKRAERPADDFWNGFERELRQKQLTALIEKRPWWQAVPLFLSRRAYVPLGATAILAFTLVSVKFYSPSQIAQIEEASMALPTELAPAAAPVAPASISAPVAQASSPLVNRHEDAQIRLENAAARAAAVEVAQSPSRVEVLPMLSAAPAVETPSSRSIAANLARLAQSEPELLDSVIGSRLSPVSARAQTASLESTELSTVPTGPSTRSRLLAQFSDRQLEPAPTAPAIVRERHARRLADSELNDRITRVGLRGDQVSLRF